ncbi:MAG TPA: hypothetical protein VHP11_08350 [Tepidisphaeraceae bacterium]|nr:hypothetical protein [Tepidisphaeraceae bacterium]
MGVYEGRAQLTKAMKQLRLQWTQTTSEWHDTMSKDFEEKHLLTLEMDLKSALSAMDHMATLLQQAHRDCE